MEASLRQADATPAEPLLAYDRESGRLTGAGLTEWIAVLALQAGSMLSRPFGHLGYGIGCKAVAAFATQREMVVRLNPDAAFATPFADGYWSRHLNRHYHYEEEIETFLRSVADFRYTFIDCGANFGYWSVLVSSEPFGAQTALAVEASPRNAERLQANAALNGCRFRCLNLAIGGRRGGFARITGRKHEALATHALEHQEQGAVRVVSLDGLVGQGVIGPTIPAVVKVDVEGVEIEAIEGATSLIGGDSIFICEEHGSDRTHGVTRHLLSATPLKVYVFDPALSRFVAIEGFDVLGRVKRHRWVGYNVFATSSELWPDRLLSARWGDNDR